MSANPVLKFTVAFDEADGEGIVFFGNYFRLAHRAHEAWLPKIGIPWVDWYKHREYGVPLRHVEADYRKPLRPGDEFEVRLTVHEIGESSVTFAYEFTSGGAVVALLKTAHVFVSRPAMKKLAIPAEIRAKLQEHRA
ncbi:MAG TPA: thioesterase family protein [Bdellovibrionales bacterium]|nr:thioesterase family protein [Bdellovibrionales bacterium]